VGVEGVEGGVGVGLEFVVAPVDFERCVNWESKRCVLGGKAEEQRVRKDIPATSAHFVLEICGGGLGGSEVRFPVWRNRTVCFIFWVICGTTLVVLWFALSGNGWWLVCGRTIKVVFDTLSE